MPEVDEDLLTQIDARQQAKAINNNGEAPDGLIAIAQAVPAGSWGGRERGWTVAYVPKAAYEHR